VNNLFIFFSFPFAYVVLFYYAPSQPLKQLPKPKQLLPPELNKLQNRNSRAVYPAVYGFELARLSLGSLSGCVSLEKRGRYAVAVNPLSHPT
jgi:hypothetical protein